MTNVRLTALTARIDSNLSQVPYPAPEQTSRGLLAGLAAVRSWLDEPSITWAGLRQRVHTAAQAEIAAHRADALGPENIPAYARADALLAIQSWMTEFESTTPEENRHDR